MSLGSNVGNRVANLARATQLIDEIPLTCVVNVSHAYETEPAYGIATPVANAVAEIRTELHPLVLMGKLLEVENELGRIRTDAATRHADVARMCVRLGAAIVNDVTGFTDPEMVQVAADTDCGCVVMHWSKDSLVARPPRRQVLLDESRPMGSAAQRHCTVETEAQAAGCGRAFADF